MRFVVLRARDFLNSFVRSFVRSISCVESNINPLRSIVPNWEHDEQKQTKNLLNLQDKIAPLYSSSLVIKMSFDSTTIIQIICKVNGIMGL